MFPNDLRDQAGLGVSVPKLSIFANDNRFLTHAI